MCKLRIRLFLQVLPIERSPIVRVVFATRCRAPVLANSGQCMQGIGYDLQRIWRQVRVEGRLHVRAEVGKEMAHRLAHGPLPAMEVGVHPCLVVVLGQIAQEGESVGGEALELPGDGGGGRGSGNQGKYLREYIFIDFNNGLPAEFIGRFIG